MVRLPCWEYRRRVSFLKGVANLCLKVWLYSAFLLRNATNTTVTRIAAYPCKSEESLAFRACTIPKTTRSSRVSCLHNSKNDALVSHFALAQFQKPRESRISVPARFQKREGLAFRACTIPKEKYAHARVYVYVYVNVYVYVHVYVFVYVDVYVDVYVYVYVYVR